MLRSSALLLCIALAAASSYPDKTNCDTEDNMTAHMWWVKPQTRTDAYTLRTGDGCGGDPTSYIPGQFLSIHLRSHTYKGQFRGLLLYAQDMAGNRVGDWQLDWPNSNMFWKPANSPCQNKSLMHLNGAEKYYHHEFKFITPPAGTGTIEFRCLIKRGPANTGEFYWPNLKGNLRLAEAGAATGNTWVQGAVGQSCTQACQANGGLACDSTLLSNLQKYGGAVQQDVLTTVGCNSPPLADNNAVGVSKDTAGWCYYPTLNVPASALTCSAVPATNAPLCPCGTAGMPSFGSSIPPPATACLNGYIAMGAAPKTSSNALSFLLVLLTGMFLNQGKPANLLILLSCFFYCAYTVEAHNWVIGVSRSFNQASTYKPCRPRVNDVPHWQINEGQEFTVQWATGHDWYFYFTVIRSDDMPLLDNTTENDLDDYIDACTNPLDDYMKTKTQARGVPNTHWRKQHMNHDPNGMTNAINPTTQQTIYTKNVSAGSPEYIPQHPKFGVDPNEVRWVYADPWVTNDVRCSYYNPKYPFLIAVHRFVQVPTIMSRAGDKDTAAFTIELSSGHVTNGYGSGQYLVQYLWRGYFDCIDVDVFPSATAVTQVGGRLLRSCEPQWNKVDHCQFEEIQSIEASCSEVVTTADRCLTQCLQNNNCNGVNVVPMWLPDTVYPLFSNRVGIPWDTMGRCPESQFSDIPRGGKVCYGLQPRLPNSTFSSYSVTDDPEDPLFYATCFVKRPSWTFDLSLTANSNITVVPVPPNWDFAGKCVDCQEWKSSQETKIIPSWNIPDQCENCLTATLPPVPASTAARIATGLKCDGSYSGKTNWYYRNATAGCASARCIKTLALVGARGQINADECIAKAKADPECSEWVQHNGANTNGCECWVKSKCCGECIPADYDFRNWQWNIYSTKTQSGDPTCATGVKSSDGNYCCEASCVDGGVPACWPQAGLQVSFQDSSIVAPIGWQVDSGLSLAARTNFYPSPAGWNTYGWSCTPGNDDRCDNDGSNYHSTVLRLDQSGCSGQSAVWTVNVPNGNYHVETLYSGAGQSMQGCRLQQTVPNYDNNHNRLGQYDMAWVARDVNTTIGTLTFTGGNQCNSIAAIAIWPETAIPTQTYCQKLPGMCCPMLYDMQNRPCSAFDPPCRLK